MIESHILLNLGGKLYEQREEKYTERTFRQKEICKTCQFDHCCRSFFPVCIF